MNTPNDVERVRDALLETGIVIGASTWPDETAQAATVLARAAISALSASPSSITLLAVVDAVRDYLPPDGISAEAFISRVIGAIDNPEINPIIKELENGRRAHQALSKGQSQS